jgi:hypothetical protein
VRDLLIICPDPSFYLYEHSNLPILYFTAIKCRESVLRREAINLMTWGKWREGIWDSVICSKVAAWIMGMEEAAMVDGFVPECARRFGETFSLDLSKGVVTARCWQTTAWSGCVERQTTFAWC